jgi:mono/diheme cytochrome c family protein
MRVHLLGPVAALLAAVLALSGCAGSDAGTHATLASGSDGAAAFAKAGCGDCHTFKAAGAKGKVGPSLDAAGLTVDLVRRQVLQGAPGMPAFGGTLTQSEIEAVASFVAGSSTGSGGKPKSFEPDGTTLATCKRNPGGLCFRQAFGNLAYTDGPAAALAEFERELGTDPAVEADCHPIAHTIGAAALRYFKNDVGKAFAAGSAICGSGYYHGLLEWKLAALPEQQVAAVARTVCTAPEIRANAFNYYQCNHGLGHGLMLYTLYDLPAALKLCHRLATSFDQVSCTGGVFMENQQSSYGLTSKWLRKDNLLYPCTIVARADKLYCYLLVTSQILPKVNFDWKKTADWCRRSDAGFVGICFQSYGRDASGVARQDPAKVRPICAEAGSGERECLFGAVRDILNNNANDLGGRRLCESVGQANRSYCFYGIGSILGTVHATPADRRSACTRFAAPRDRPDCVAGAKSAAGG